VKIIKARTELPLDEHDFFTPPMPSIKNNARRRPKQLWSGQRARATDRFGAPTHDDDEARNLVEQIEFARRAKHRVPLVAPRRFIPDECAIAAARKPRSARPASVIISSAAKFLRPVGNTAIFSPT